MEDLATRFGDADRGLGPCPLCGRPMVAGPSLDRHHWVPKSEGGDPEDWAWMHQVCHRKVHAVFNEKTLAAAFRTADTLRAHADIAAFVRWVRRKHPEFIDHHRSPRRTR
jgi:hypothetical protein